MTVTSNAHRPPPDRTTASGTVAASARRGSNTSRARSCGAAASAASPPPLLPPATAAAPPPPRGAPAAAVAAAAAGGAGCSVSSSALSAALSAARAAAAALAGASPRPCAASASNSRRKLHGLLGSCGGRPGSGRDTSCSARCRALHLSLVGCGPVRSGGARGVGPRRCSRRVQASTRSQPSEQSTTATRACVLAVLTGGPLTRSRRRGCPPAPRP